MSFSYRPDNDLGRLRLAIGDTIADGGPRPERRNYSDEELGVILAEGATWRAAVPVVLRLLSREWANMADISIGEYSQRYGAIAERYMRAAREAEDALSATGQQQSGGFVAGAVNGVALWLTE